MTKERDSRAIIIGAGIGGLAAATALTRAKMDVTVLERRFDATQIQSGAGMVLWPNALRALEQLGLADAVRAVGLPLEGVRFRTPRGARLGAFSVSDVGARLGTTALTISRKALLGALASAVDERSIRLGAKCIGFDQDDAF